MKTFNLFQYLKKLIRILLTAFTHKVFGKPITHIPSSEKVIALTYDDGPNLPFTEQLLNTFERFQVKVTFFAVGKNIEEHPETIRLIYSKGHELGNHSYSHKNMRFENLFSIMSELKKTEYLCKQLGVSLTNYVRPPFGAIGLFFLIALRLMRKQMVLWSIDPRDFAASSVEDIENSILDAIKPGGIILLHDGGGDRSLTVAATERLILELHRRGYQFKTISELVLLRS